MDFKLIFKETFARKDKFQIMYEIFLNEKKEIIETGEILFANLELAVKITVFTFLTKKEAKATTIKMVRVLKRL